MKYRHEILRGRVAEPARDLIRQICQSRDVVLDRTGHGLAGSHTPVVVGSARSVSGESGAVHQRPVKPAPAAEFRGRRDAAALEATRRQALQVPVGSFGFDNIPV
jgi:hypothetical protein